MISEEVFGTPKPAILNHFHPKISPFHPTFLTAKAVKVKLVENFNQKAKPTLL